MVGNKNARYMLYIMGGIYILFMVRELWIGLGTAGSEKPIMILFIGLFSLIGTGMIIMSARQIWRNKKQK